MIEAGYGWAERRSGRPIMPETPFQIASVSKQLTAGAILLLQEQGGLSVHDSLERWLPQCPDYASERMLWRKPLIAQLQPEESISLHIYELAGSYNLGTPIKRQQRTAVQVFFFVLLAFLLCITGWLCYNIYAAIAYIILSHIYPHFYNVPPDQWSNYFWLQAIYDNFWSIMLQSALPLLTGLGLFITYYHAYRTKLYLCTDGLLKIYKKKVEVARWDEVQDFYLSSNGIVTRLVKLDSSSLAIPQILMGSKGKKINTLISDELTRHLLPGALARYIRGETLRFGLLKVNEQGIYHADVLVAWDRIGDVILQGGHVSAFYGTKSYGYKKNDKSSCTDNLKWHSLQKSGAMGLTYPNLPVLVVLANIVLARRDFEQAQAQGTTASEVKQIRKDVAALALRKYKRRVKIVVILSLIALPCVIVAISFLLAYIFVLR